MPYYSQNKNARLHSVQNHRTEASDNLETLHPVYPEALFINSLKRSKEKGLKSFVLPLNEEDLPVHFLYRRMSAIKIDLYTNQAS